MSATRGNSAVTEGVGKVPTVIQVKVKPSSRVSALTQVDDGSWLVQLKSLPIDGQANVELVALIAQHFGCRKSAVTIKSGASGRTKLVKIDLASILFSGRQSRLSPLLSGLRSVA